MNPPNPSPDNVQLRGANASAEMGGLGERECVEMCRQNRDDRGRTVLCSSALYESGTRRCQLFRRASAPDGELQRAPGEGHRLFEKFCFAEDLPTECAAKQFIRVSAVGREMKGREEREGWDILGSFRTFGNHLSAKW